MREVPLEGCRSPRRSGAGDRAGGSGELTTALARQAVDGVLAGEGAPDEVVDARGLAVVSDEGELVAAVDAALAAQPDVVEKIRGGKVAAAGAIVGAVMKATRGKADASGCASSCWSAAPMAAPRQRSPGRADAGYARLGQHGRGGAAGGYVRPAPPPPPTWMRITRSSLETGLPPFLFTVPSHRKPSGPMAAGPSRP